MHYDAPGVHALDCAIRKDTATGTLEKRLSTAAEQAGRLCRLNLAVHGLEGDIRRGGNINSY